MQQEEIKLIEQLKALKTGSGMPQSDREKIFLNSLRSKLEIYISQNPAKTGKIETFYYNIKSAMPFVDLKNIGVFNNTYAGSAAFALIVLAIGIGTIASASQASLPGDNFYPVKILSEEIRSSFTASPAAKALLETEFAAKRVEEIKQVIQKNGIESKKIDAALEHLEKNTAKAANIIFEEKQKGNDVSGLAKDIEVKNTANQKKLEQILKKQEEADDAPEADKIEKNKNSSEKSNKKEQEENREKDQIKKDKGAKTSAPGVKTRAEKEKISEDSAKEDND